MNAPIEFRWLGVAGIELRVGERVLAIDPFVTRPPWRRLWTGHAEPDAALVAENVQRCDLVLVTHAHWDHLLDVPEVARRTGAQVYGSANSCGLLAALGVPEEQIHAIAVGDRLDLPPFAVEVLPAVHTSIFGRPIFTGPLSRDLRPPLRLRDYRMDVNFSFHVTAGDVALLDWSSETTDGAPAADVLFVKPFGTRAYYRVLLRAVWPRLVVPIHWDDFFRPLSQPVRPMMRPPTWSVPPLRRVNLHEFRQLVGELAPSARVLVPRMFQRYELQGRL